MLALIAGKGDLPATLIAALEARPLVAALEGFPPSGVTPDETFRIEQLGSFLTALSARGVRQVCFAGAVERPPIDQTKIDPETMPLVPRMIAAMGQGDDATLREVLAIFEDAGLAITSAAEIAPDLLPPAGLLVGAPPADIEKEIARARGLLAAMGAVDVGQACVVRKGQALALEGLFGTDWMLESLRKRPDGRGGVLYKGPKPGQDRRIDLPTIGSDTVTAAAAAGLDGLVIEADGVMLLNRDAVVAKAEALGLFVLVHAT